MSRVPCRRRALLRLATSPRFERAVRVAPGGETRAWDRHGAAAGRDVHVYAPYGAAWFRYFMRRRAEAQGA